MIEKADITAIAAWLTLNTDGNPTIQLHDLAWILRTTATTLTADDFATAWADGLRQGRWAV